jgi:hypothetical protein
MSRSCVKHLSKLFVKEEPNVYLLLVGRPGLDPGTLGVGPERPTASVVVQITWSEDSPSPPTSAEILTNLSPWLHHWLHSIGNDVIGDVIIRGADGRQIDVLVGRAEE